MPGCRKGSILRSFTPTIANSLIERIEVHNNDKYDSYCHARTDVYFTVVGILDSPVKRKALICMKEVQDNPQSFKFAA